MEAADDIKSVLESRAGLTDDASEAITDEERGCAGPTPTTAATNNSTDRQQTKNIGQEDSFIFGVDDDDSDKEDTNGCKADNGEEALASASAEGREQLIDREAADEELKQKSRRIMAWTRRSSAERSEKSFLNNDSSLGNISIGSANIAPLAPLAPMAPMAPMETITAAAATIDGKHLQTAAVLNSTNSPHLDESQPGAHSVDGPVGNVPRDTASIYSHHHHDIRAGLNHSVSDDNDGPIMVSAMTVSAHVRENQDELEANIRELVRKEILEGATEAEVISSESTRSRKVIIFLVVAINLIIIMGAIGLTIGLTRTQSGDGEDDSKMTSENITTSTATPSSLNVGTTLQEVKKRGYVNCGVYENSVGFGSFNIDANRREGINVDQCRAIAVLALGDPTLHKEVITPSNVRFSALQNGTIDVLTKRTTHTMGRDVFTPSEGVGFAFSTPYLYTGSSFGGVPDFVDCADNLETFAGICRQLRICVTAGSSHEAVLEALLAAAYIVRTRDRFEHIEHLQNGTCNVFARDLATLGKSSLQEQGYLGEYKIGRRLLSREPLALTTRDNDSEWTALVNSAVELSFTAEALNLTQNDAQQLLLAEVEVEASHEESYIRILHMTAAVGNYGEVYRRNLEESMPREGLNRLYDTNNTTSGLLYYMPFGNLDAAGPGPLPGSSMDQVIRRGYLICGIHSKPAGFAKYDNQTKTWNGMAVEYCKALNAAVHLGTTNNIVYMEVTDEDEAHRMLMNKTVDVISGARLTLKKNDATLGTLDVSAPWYFYDASGNAAFGMATRPEDDSTWRDFVNWIVMATFYAEGNNITSANPTDMPIVGLFGESFKSMFLDSIAAAGSYKEIYQRTMQFTAMPAARSAMNFLNEDSSGPQQFPLPLS